MYFSIDLNHAITSIQLFIRKASEYVLSNDVSFTGSFDSI